MTIQDICPGPTRRLLLAAAVIAIAAGCGNPAGGKDHEQDPRIALDPRQLTDIPTTAAHINGTITRAQPGTDTRPKASGGSPNGSVSCPPNCGSSGVPLQGILIEETPGSQGGDNKSYITVLKTSRLLRWTPSGAVAITFADLKVGQRAQAWFAGAVRHSYPSQADADVVLITDP